MQYTEYLGCFHTVSSLFSPEHNLTVDGEQTLTLDEMMQHYARACDGGCICLICGKCLSWGDKCANSTLVLLLIKATIALPVTSISRIDWICTITSAGIIRIGRVSILIVLLSSTNLTKHTYVYVQGHSSGHGRTFVDCKLWVAF